MISSYLILLSATIGWFALLTLLLFSLGRRCDWLARPPAIDLIVILYTVAPWGAAWIVGMRIHQHWAGGFGGLATSAAAQIIALELFDFIHLRYALRSGIRSLEINGAIERKFGKWNNRVCLWLTIPSIPFFLANRFGFMGYVIFEKLLGFTHFNTADYITVSRQKIKNLIGADLVWCLYCDWMTGGWTLTTEILNEVESFWCPLQFADHGKCEKCAQFFRTGHWAQPGCTSQEMSHVAGLNGGGKFRKPEPVPAGTPSFQNSRRSSAPDDGVPTAKP
jgi:hypothetical protein